LRLHDVYHDAVRLRLLERGTRAALPDRMVRRVAVDADADHSRNPHQPPSVPAKSRERGAHVDERRDHGGRHLASDLATRLGARLHAAAAPLLAPARVDAARLRGPHAGGEGVAGSARLDLGPTASEPLRAGAAKCTILHPGYRVGALVATRRAPRGGRSPFGPAMIDGVGMMGARCSSSSV